MREEIERAIKCLVPPKPRWDMNKGWGNSEIQCCIAEESTHLPYDGSRHLMLIVETCCNSTLNKETKKFEYNVDEGVYFQIEKSIRFKALNALQDSIYCSVREPKRTKLWKWLQNQFNDHVSPSEQFSDVMCSVFKFYDKNENELNDKTSKASKQLYAMAKLIRDKYDKSVQ